MKKVISALDETIEAVRADNGYSASQPEERRLVLDALRAAGLRLKEDTQISLTYLNEIALKPLVVVVKRFGKAAVGLSATAARKAIIDWLKENGIDILKGIVK